MGAGKTSVGRQLAKLLNKNFQDSDHEIEHRTGVDIPLIFEIEGEEGFRKREQAVIDELTSQTNIVLATGGGAVLDETNRSNLGDRGIVIYLSASVDQLLARTGKDKNRPLLQTSDPRARLEELMAIRDPLYRQVASLMVDTDGCAVRDVVNKIIELIGQK